jgi:hypothetical protein
MKSPEERAGYKSYGTMHPSESILPIECLYMLAEMGFGKYGGYDAYGWPGPPYLIYLPEGTVLNKTTGQNYPITKQPDPVTLRQALAALGWYPELLKADA